MEVLSANSDTSNKKEGGKTALLVVCDTLIRQCVLHVVAIHRELTGPAVQTLFLFSDCTIQWLCVHCGLIYNICICISSA